MADPKRRIGGSMIAKILKLSKWGTPLDAYLELTDPPPATLTQKGVAMFTGAQPNPEQQRGIFLEPAIREWTNARVADEGLKFDKPNPGVLVHPEWEWATVSPDGLHGFHSAYDTKPQALLEIKAPRRDDLYLWGEEGSDEVPTDALVQTHWGLMVTNAREGVVAALLGGDLRIFRVKRDPELEAKMLAKAKEFVERYVLPGVPPEPTFGDDDNVRRMFPRHEKPALLWADLTPTQQEVVTEYLSAYAEAKRAEKAVEGWEPQIKMLIGDTEGIIVPGGRIDWRANRTGPTRWKALAEELLASMPEEEVQRLLLSHAGEPARPLVPRIKEQKR